MIPLPTWPCNYPVNIQQQEKTKISLNNSKKVTDFDKLLASIFLIPSYQPTLFDIEEYVSDSVISKANEIILNKSQKLEH